MNKVIEKVKEFSKNKTYVSVAVGVVAVVLILVVLSSGMNSPKSVSNKFMKALTSADSDKLMKVIYFDEDDYDEEDVEEAVENICDEIDDEDEDVEYEFKKVSSKSKKSAKVKYKVTVDDDSETITVYLKKVDGKWKVDLYKTMTNGLSF